MVYVYYISGSSFFFFLFLRGAKKHLYIHIYARVNKKKKKKIKLSFLDMAVGCKSASGMRGGRSNPETGVGRCARAHIDTRKQP